jgi:hypothetical protein
MLAAGRDICKEEGEVERFQTTTTQVTTPSKRRRRKTTTTTVPQSNSH